MTNIIKIIDEWAILGRPGYAGKKKRLRRSELATKFGENNWTIFHLVDGKLLSREDALTHFEKSYLKYFSENPETLEWLINYASEIYDTAPSNVDSKLDYSIQETEAAHLHDIAIRRVLKQLGREFQGNTLLQIRGEESDGYILTTGQIAFYKPELIINPQLKGWWKKNSIESYWQSNKVLAVKFEKLVSMSRPMIGVVLRKDIHMGKGKFSAQASHAIVSLLPQRGLKWDFDSKPIEIWTVSGEENLLGIYRRVSKLDINSSIIQDAGKTQLAPGTRTSVGIGPINEALFDKIMCEYEATPLESAPRTYCKFKNLTISPF
ncbi:MAG TPA: peptidyl-tRNA hydrolase [Candidatus Bathyarchaeia archaeon]|nr:peptidyl-tRNA hydrolase [Candidatus Bathyarchaeia archaeon]